MTLRAVPGENPTLSVSTDGELSAIQTGYLVNGDFLFSQESGVFLIDKTSTAPLSSTILPTLESAGGSLAGRLFFTGIGPTGGGGSSNLPPLPASDGDYVLRVVSGIGTWVQNPTFQSVEAVGSITSTTGDIVAQTGAVEATLGDVRGKTLTIRDGSDKTFETDPTDPSGVAVTVNFRGSSILADYFTGYAQFRLRNAGSGDFYNVAQFDATHVIISDATALETRLDGVGVSIPGIYLDLSGANTELRLSGSPGGATQRATSQGVGLPPIWAP